MKWNIDPSPLPSYIRVDTEGTAVTSEVAEMWDDLLASEYWRPGLSTLFDNRRLQTFSRTGPGVEMTQDASEYFERRAADIGSSRIAFLTTAHENYPLVRQFQISLSTRRMAATIQIFYDESDAIDWLSSGQASHA